MVKKISKLNINKILIQPNIDSYLTGIAYLKKELNLPVYRFKEDENNYDIKNSLILFETSYNDVGKKAFKDFFGYEIGEFGLIKGIKFEIEI
jgi:hypothetical protein